MCCSCKFWCFQFVRIYSSKRCLIDRNTRIRIKERNYFVIPWIRNAPEALHVQQDAPLFFRLIHSNRTCQKKKKDCVHNTMGYIQIC